MKKRFCVKSICLCMCFALFLATSSAASKNNTTPTISSKIENFELNLFYDVSITNKEIGEEIDHLKGSVVDIVFCYPMEEDDISIGFVGILETWEEIKDIAVTELLDTIELYQEDKRLPNLEGDVHIDNFKIMNVRTSISTEKTIDFKLAKEIEKKVYPQTFDVKNDVKKQNYDQFNLLATSNSYNAHHALEYHYYYTNWAYGIVHYKNNQINRYCKVYGQEIFPDDFLQPHEGDGHERFAEGFQWQPDYIQVGFDTNYSYGYNRVKLFYEYLSSNGHMNNLQETGNEGLEISITFYNYPYATISTQKGTTYVEQYGMNDGVVWSSNQPTSYLDTGFNFFSSGGDDADLVTYCIGVEDASQLTTNHYYYWYIKGVSGIDRGTNRYDNDGRFVVNCNRTYESSSVFSILGSYLDGAPGQVTWKRFEEEHEGTVVPGIAKALNPAVQQNWYNGYVSTPNYSAWYLASTHTEWEYDSSSDPVMLK